MIIFYKGCKTNIEGMKYDTRWEEQTSVNEFDIYQINSKYQSTINKLPTYLNKTQMQSTKYLFYKIYTLHLDEDHLFFNFLKINLSSL